MLDVLRKSMGILDCLIILAAVFLFARMDFANLSTLNVIYMVTFALWLIMLLARIFIIYKRRRR